MPLIMLYKTVNNAGEAAGGSQPIDHLSDTQHLEASQPDIPGQC